MAAPAAAINVPPPKERSPESKLLDLSVGRAREIYLSLSPRIYSKPNPLRKRDSAVARIRLVDALQDAVVPLLAAYSQLLDDRPRSSLVVIAT